VPLPRLAGEADPLKHKFQAGDGLTLSGGADQVRRKGGACTVVAALPIERSGSLRYRVKLEKEGFERIVVEADLVRLEDARS
jgi:hypothetical protein